MNENCIEWINGDTEATVTFSHGRFANKIIKLAEHDNNIKLIAVNNDNSVTATLPLKYIKIGAPRKMSEAQIEQARERMSQMIKNRTTE